MSKNSDKGEGQDKGKTDSPVHGHAHMAPQPDAPPGQEQDGRGNVIPFAQRTKDDKEKASKG